MNRFPAFVFAVYALCASAFGAELVPLALIMGDPSITLVADRTDRITMNAAALKIAAGHEALQSALRTKGIAVAGSTEMFVNALYIYADPSRMQELQTLPGVKGVVRLPRITRSLDRAVQLTNVPAAWNLLNGVGNAGAGVKIGIIDTGIESTHAAFRDTTLKTPTGFPICLGTDCLYTNNKVIVARSYVKFVAAGFVTDPSTQTDPISDRPDDLSARDRDGHGTAVAMAAAGNTNTGIPDTITGVAPKAFLGNYKVFGSPGLNDYSTAYAINRALQDAYSDGMDIIVYASGSPALTGALDTGAACGQSAAYSCDLIAVAFDNAAKAGKVIVVAAGNYGNQGSVNPNLQSVTSPAIAPNVIAVAASTNSHSFYSTIMVGVANPFSQPVSYRSNYAGPIPATKLSAPLSDIAATGDGTGCTIPSTASLAGTITLVARGTCTFLDKVRNAALAGAAGVIFTNDPGDNMLITPGGLGGTPIPSVLVGYDDGQAIRSALVNVPGALATFDSTLAAAEAAPNWVADFSSRGPATGSFALKPDIAAPGTGIFTAGETYDPAGAFYSPSGYVSVDGTSIAAPIVAGAAALVKQAHPTMAGSAIRSSLINTASQDVSNPIGGVASVLAVGAGKLNAAAAVNNNLIVSPATVSFGVVNSLPATQQISLSNIGATPLTLAIAINRRSTETNAKTSISVANMTLAPGATNSFNFTLTGGKPAPGIYEGLITVAGAAGPLVVPYVYLVGDGVPANAVALIGDNDEGNVSDYASEGAIAVRLTDQYGIPITASPVSFGVIAGDGKILHPDVATDAYGIAYAQPVLGPNPGQNVFYASVGGLTTTFTDTARLKPTVSGAVSAASYEASKAVAPGSYIALFGSGLSDVSQGEATAALPVVLGDVSVSFDAPGIAPSISPVSVPGHLYYVSPGQVNVQVPWELAGQTNAQMKVTVGYSAGSVYQLPIAAFTPAIFEYPLGQQLFAAARDENAQLVTTTNPAKQGHTIAIYCNGLGPVSNQPASGEPAPSTNLAVTPTTPIVTIGGLPAKVSFSGLTPTLSSLYQLNVVIPNTGAGTQPVTVSIGGVVSKQSNIAVQ